MCRLAWIPEVKKVPEKVLAELFAFLESSQGGAGNGFGGFVNGEVVIEKGLKLTTEEIAKKVRSIDWDNGIIFHTRMASKGSVLDKNCHPFSYGNTIVCHNGTFYSASEYAIQMLMDGMFVREMKGGCEKSPDGKHLPKKKYGRSNDAEFECAFCDKDLVDITDSEIISFLIGKYGTGILKTLMKNTYSNVFLIMDKDGVSAYTSGSFEVLEVKKGVFIYASDFPGKTVQAKYPNLVKMMIDGEKSGLLYTTRFTSGMLFTLEKSISSIEDLASERIKEETVSTYQGGYWDGNVWTNFNSQNCYHGGRQSTKKEEKKDLDISPELFASLIVGNTILNELECA